MKREKEIVYIKNIEKDGDVGTEEGTRGERGGADIAQALRQLPPQSISFPSYMHKRNFEA
jgi:hypothetical protein